MMHLILKLRFMSARVTRSYLIYDTYLSNAKNTSTSISFLLRKIVKRYIKNIFRKYYRALRAYLTWPQNVHTNAYNNKIVCT